jgi:ATP diphosphatase
VSGVARLIEIMARLRDPEQGCPWDAVQTFETIAPYTIEEAYEVDDAIRRGDLAALREELGDLLLQVVYHARMAQERGAFDFEAVVADLCGKLVRRHPHVFGAGAEKIGSASAQTEAWEAHKARERAAGAATDGRRASALDGVALGLPALLRAQKLVRRAARAGLAKAEPDSAAARAAAALEALQGRAASGAGDEDAALGALLLAAVELAVSRDVDAEQALREATARHEAVLRAREAAGDP